jgi:protein TonB
MSGSSSQDSPSRKSQPQEDALDDSSSGATALGRTLEAELTRAATRANPASLTEPAASAAPAAPSASPVPPATPAGTPAELDLDLISASSPASADAPAATEGDAPAAEDPDADADGDDAQRGASRRPRIGWGGVLALLNVVLSGFILMLWGVPRWDGARIGAAARAKNDGAGAGTGVRAGAGGNRVDSGRGDAGRLDPNQARAASATGEGGTTSTAAASVGGGAARLNAASGPGGGGLGRTTQSGAAGAFGASGASAASAERGDAGAGDGGRDGVEVPELPQAIISVMPGQRAPDVTVPPPPPQPSQPPAGRDDNAVAVGGAVNAGADAAIEAGNAAAGGTGGNAGSGVASRVPIAGADGVTMPERLAESHVRPTIAALADGEPVTGEVTLAATIRIDGSVADVQVLSSSRPGAGLEHAAADAVRRWRYKPATRDGQPIDSRLTITVTFR